MTRDRAPVAPLSVTARCWAELGILFELTQTLQSIATGAGDGAGTGPPTAARVGDLIGAIVEGCREHRDFAEEEGLLAEVETRVGRPHEVELVRRDHDLMVQFAQELAESFNALSTRGELALIGPLVTRFEAALREHGSHEDDLVQEAFRDTGAGD
ncbi:MAG: hemerythrin domain-containing protein [Dehalococcoidia bacterium]